jgi:ATP-binding cassette, subfamily F, member 3
LREQRAKPAKEKPVKVDAPAPATPVAPKPDKREAAEDRQRLTLARRPLQKRIDTIEKELAKLTASRDALDAWLASESAYAMDNASSLGEKTRERGELAARVEVLEAEWMEKHEAMQWVR